MPLVIFIILLSGGTLALWLWRTNFNISAAVGYIAVFGVSVLNGVVLVSSIRLAWTEGLTMIGFLPAALSHGIGAEIQRPLARVVIGGLISSTALTLFVLPAISAWIWQRHEPREAEEEPRPR